MNIFRTVASAMKTLFHVSCLICLIFNISVIGDSKPGFPPTVDKGASLEVVYEEDAFFEGPAWDPVSSKLYFTAFKKDNQQILRLDDKGKASVWMNQTKGINGMRLSQNGRLLGAQVYAHKVLSIKIGSNGPVEIKSLTNNDKVYSYIQPNDVAEDVRGGIYFSDPDFKERKNSSVFYLNPEGEVIRIITSRKIPNGILVSNDGKILFVGDSFEKKIYSYPVKADGTVDQNNEKVFFEPLTDNTNDPDGMCSDEKGNLYFAMRGGVWVSSPAGQTLGFIPITEFASNVAFGGIDSRTLFITCKGKVYSLKMNVKGRN